MLKPGGVLCGDRLHTGNPRCGRSGVKTGGCRYPYRGAGSVAGRLCAHFLRRGVPGLCPQAGLSGFVPYEPDGWMPDIAAAIDYYWHTKRCSGWLNLKILRGATLG
ncbi:hypothetical protein M8494_10280 [Serratia ureilytica]